MTEELEDHLVRKRQTCNWQYVQVLRNIMEVFENIFQTYNGAIHRLRRLGQLTALVRTKYSTNLNVGRFFKLFLELHHTFLFRNHTGLPQGFFPMSMSLVTAILGTSTTYLVIAIQFWQSTTSI